MTDESWPGKPIDLPDLALSLGRLALSGFSLVMIGQLLWLSGGLRFEFASENLLGVRPRQALLLAIGAGLFLPLGLALLVWLLRRRAGFLHDLRRFSICCAPLGVAFVLPGLFLSQMAEAKPLFYLTVLLAFGVSFQGLLAEAFALRRTRLTRPLDVFFANRIARAAPFFALLCGAAWFVKVLGHYAILHHRLIQTTSSDVGIADNVMANLLRHHAFSAPAFFGTVPGSYLSVHAEYGALLFLPIYGLKPGVETLFWLQATLAALAVVPLYLLVAGRLGRRLGCWFGLGYLLLAPLHGALLTGFSWMPAVILASFTLYYAVETKRRWLVALSAPILLALSEYGALGGLAFALYLIVSRKNTRLGLGLGVLAVSVLVLDFARFAHGLGAGDHSPLLDAAHALLQNPVYFTLDLARGHSLTSILHALAPLCLLPLFEPICWPLFIPALLATSAGARLWPALHCDPAASLSWIAPAFLALLIRLQRERAEPSRRHAYLAWLVALTITQLSHSYNYGALLRADGFGGEPASALFRMTPAGQARYDALSALVKKIPATASVATTDYLLPHVSDHADACELSLPCGEPDFILLSSREVGRVRSSLSASLRTHHYRLIGKGLKEFYLFAHAKEDKHTAATLRELDLD